MKKIMLLGVLLMALTGCSSLSGDTQAADCVAKVKIFTFGGQKSEPVKIKAKRIDRFDQEWVRVQNRWGYARFSNTWQKKDTFYDYVCKS